MSYPEKENKYLVEFFENLNECFKKSRKMQLGGEESELCVPMSEIEKLEEENHETVILSLLLANLIVELRPD